MSVVGSIPGIGTDLALFLLGVGSAGVALGAEAGSSESPGGLPFSEQVLSKTDRFHSFPSIIGDQVLRYGTETEVSSTYTVYSLPGQIEEYKGVFQVGVDTARYSVPTITHWFFKKGG